MNAQFAKRATGDLKGIFGHEERPLASCGFQHDPRLAIVDGPSTMVISGSQAKIHAWHDNEWAPPTFVTIRNMAFAAQGP